MSQERRPKDNSNRDLNHPPRRPPQNARGRGRGRGYHDHQSDVLRRLGVSDLRQLIERKREEKNLQQETSPVHADDARHPYPQSRGRGRGRGRGENRGRGRGENRGRFEGRGRGNQRGHGRGRERSQETAYLHDVYNIKVEISTATGEKTYLCDEKHKLPDLKHVPDYATSPLSSKSVNSSSSEENHADRGRRQGNQRRNYQSRVINRKRNTSLSDVIRNELNLPSPTPIQNEENWDEEIRQNENKQMLQTNIQNEATRENFDNESTGNEPTQQEETNWHDNSEGNEAHANQGYEEGIYTSSDAEYYHEGTEGELDENYEYHEGTEGETDENYEYYSESSEHQYENYADEYVEDFYEADNDYILESNVVSEIQNVDEGNLKNENSYENFEITVHNSQVLNDDSNENIHSETSKNEGKITSAENLEKKHPIECESTSDLPSNNEEKSALTKESDKQDVDENTGKINEKDTSTAEASDCSSKSNKKHKDKKKKVRINAP